jgi:hypothetical protein
MGSENGTGKSTLVEAIANLSRLPVGGESGNAIWGKAAKWVLYSGLIDDAPMSVAILDPPTNLRHPTTWHACDYGLVAANPFGLQYFQGQAKNSGDYMIKLGEELQLRYPVVFIRGIATAEEINRRFAAFDPAAWK